jgi:hypothetical protein
VKTEKTSIKIGKLKRKLKNKFRGKMSHEMLCPKCHRPMIIVENHILTPLGEQICDRVIINDVNTEQFVKNDLKRWETYPLKFNQNICQRI